MNCLPAGVLRPGPPMWGGNPLTPPPAAPARQPTATLWRVEMDFLFLNQNHCRPPGSP